jgi:hypothetical protein
MLAQIILAAGTAFVEQIQWDAVPGHTEELAINQAEQCIQYLYEIGESFPSAHRFADSLRESTQRQQAVVQSMNEPSSWESLYLELLRSQDGNTTSAHNDGELDYGPSPWHQTTYFDEPVEASVMDPTAYFSSDNQWEGYYRRGRPIPRNLMGEIPCSIESVDISEGKPFQIVDHEFEV